MRKTVHSKLIGCYILIGILSFLFATAGGSHFVETYLEGEVGTRLHDSAVRFASDEITVQQLAAGDISGLEKLADILSTGEGAGILVLDQDFQVLVQSPDLDYSLSYTESAVEASSAMFVSSFPALPQPANTVIAARNAIPVTIIFFIFIIYASSITL